jgi:CheY-specific phosphatase CheX
MGIKFFGQYLLENGVVTAAELLEAVKYQESRNLKFGDYARSKGYLTDDDVRRLNDEQKRTDMMIGELTVKMGLLSHAQVEEILTMQKNDHVFIGAALVQKGFIAEDALRSQLERFREDQKAYVPGEIAVPEGLDHPDAVKRFVDLTQKMLRRVSHLDVKVGDGAISVSEPAKNFAVVSIRFTGAQNCDYVLAMPRAAAAAVASGILGQDASKEGDEIVLDGVKEFLNIVCGNIAADLAKRGKSVEMSPPSEAVHYTNGYSVIKRRKAAHYPLVSTEGTIELIIIEG